MAAAPKTHYGAAHGLNGRSETVGPYFDSSGDHGFLDHHGMVTAIDVPGASGTLAYGINAGGQIVGT